MTPEVTVQDLEALRGPLTGYCYRLLGAAADADDAVQETIIRALHRCGQITQMVTFLGTGERFAEFGLPATLPAAPAPERG